MSERFDQLHAQHSNLLRALRRAARQLAESAEEIEHELRPVGSRAAAVRRVLRSPALIGGAIVVVALVGPRRVAALG